VSACVRWPRRKRWLFAIAFLSLGPAQVSASLTREVYVWQRQSSVELTNALNSLSEQVDALCLLAVEVGWSQGKMNVMRPRIDFEPVLASRRRVGLALRIGAFAGSFASNDSTALALVVVASETIADAQKAGLVVSELQIDFDCAESKLAGYREWLVAMRVATGSIPLVITALPTWLKHPEFSTLAKTADGFVLQVHSLVKPSHPDHAFTLCDPVQALAWARRAGEIGVPFRVALPTYGYLLTFDRDGKFFSLGAEGRPPQVPPEGKLCAVRADAPAMARLANALAAAPPPNCVGVIWFRLPIKTDRLNWDAITFATVLRGEVPRRELRINVEWTDAGVAVVTLVNAGQTTEELPLRIDLHGASAGRLVAGDGFGGFRLETRGDEVQGIVRAAEISADASIAPGRQEKIAWLRFVHEIPLDASLPARP
jgi:hypothetical protein